MADETFHEDQKLQLSADQFTLNEKGELVIKNDEIVQAIKNAPEVAQSPEAGTITVGVSVSVS
ncbi:hypothetical protein F8S13_04835 [Chloroflexia bacterium SDU3-3]|nr:hypothetical protein F8S13_04835 [Chloroflexia bacterium SDU3-3]